MNAGNRQQAVLNAAANVRDNGRTKAEPRARLITLLDRAIALLMAAIVLTLACPVGLALWGQSRAAQAGVVCLNDAQSQTARRLADMVRNSA